MSTYTRNKYNVYKDGQLIVRDVRAKEAAHFADCDQAIISTYAKEHSKHKSKDGFYTFEITSTEILESKPKSSKGPVAEDKQIIMPDEWIAGWNNMRAAVQALETHHGKMVQRNGKRFVEVNL